MNSFELLYYAYAPRRVREIISSNLERPSILRLLWRQMTPSRWIALGLGIIAITSIWERLITGGSAIFSLSQGNPTFEAGILSLILISGYLLTFNLPSFMYNWLMYPFFYIALISAYNLWTGHTHYASSLVIALSCGLGVMFIIANREYSMRTRLSYELYEAHISDDDISNHVATLLADPEVRHAIDNVLQRNMLQDRRGKKNE